MHGAMGLAAASDRDHDRGVVAARVDQRRRFEAWAALGTPLWVIAVLGALTFAASELESRPVSVWRTLIALALTAGHGRANLRILKGPIAG